LRMRGLREVKSANPEEWQTPGGLAESFMGGVFSGFWGRLCLDFLNFWGWMGCGSRICFLEAAPHRKRRSRS